MKNMAKDQITLSVCQILFKRVASQEEKRTYQKATTTMKPRRIQTEGNVLKKQLSENFLTFLLSHHSNSPGSEPTVEITAGIQPNN